MFEANSWDSKKGHSVVAEQGQLPNVPTSIGQDAAPGSIRWQLREATRSDHDAIEECLSLRRRALTLVEYRWLLQTYYGFYLPIERLLGRLDWRHAAVDFAARRKASLIAADLADLGLDANQIDRLPQCVALPASLSLYEGLGALYVLEGATLGGQSILWSVAPALGLSASNGARFFASYGVAVGPMWRSFLAVLEDLRCNREARVAIERSAVQTFGNLRVWLEASKERVTSDFVSGTCETDA